MTAKQQAAPKANDAEESSHFESLLERLVRVPKREADQQEAKYQKEREQERKRPPKRRVAG